MEQSQSDLKADGALKDNPDPDQKNDSASLVDISDSEMDTSQVKESNQ